MQFRTLSAILFTGLLLTVSCKKDKDPEINPCMNGQLDPGETQIDCGGSCGPCPSTEFPSAGFTVNLYGDSETELSASIRELTVNGNWSLRVGNDSIDVRMNLGNSGMTGTFAMNPTGSYASYNGVNYPTLSSGIYTISAHNTTTEKMSGFFHAKFSRGVIGDTLYITNGYFEYLPY